MATDRIINQTQGDEIITALTAIKNAINNQPVPTGVEDTVAAAFDSGTSYAVGDFCIYNGMLYKCTTAHHGNWDGSDFTLTTMGAQVTSLNQALDTVNSKLVKCIDIPITITGNGGTSPITKNFTKPSGMSHIVAACMVTIDTEYFLPYQAITTSYTFLVSVNISTGTLTFYSTASWPNYTLRLYYV